MSKSFVAVLVFPDGKEETRLYVGSRIDSGNWDIYYRDTASPDVGTSFLMIFEIKGRTYAERKEYLRNMAIDFQAEDVGGLSMCEMGEIADWFEENGRRYGLLEEFRENGIC